MDARLVAKYFTLLKEKTGFTIEVWAEKANGSVSTLKNLLSGKTEDPRIATIAPYIYAAGGSLDEMYTGERKEADNEYVQLIKEMCEHQARMNETHINNTRAHYEQHRKDSIENYEKRLADKREIIEEKEKHIKSLKKEMLYSKIFSLVCVGILVALLIAEVMNPNLGWLRF